MPSTLGGKALMFQAVIANLPGLQVEMGLTNTQRERALDMAAQFLNGYEFRSQVAAWDDGVGTWFEQMMNGDGDGNTGGELADPPPAPAFTDSANQMYGVIKGFRKEREMWMTLPGWTKAIGETLMVVKPESQPLVPANISPSLKATAGQSGFEVTLVVGDRGGMLMFDVDIRRKGGEWTLLTTLGGKGATLTISPTTPGEPEVIDIRVRMKDKSNQLVGNVSETRTVTINP